MQFQLVLRSKSLSNFASNGLVFLVHVWHQARQALHTFSDNAACSL